MAQKDSTARASSYNDNEKNSIAVSKLFKITVHSIYILCQLRLISVEGVNPYFDNFELIIQFWREAIQPSEFVSDIIENGYKIPFKETLYLANLIIGHLQLKTDLLLRKNQKIT